MNKDEMLTGYIERWLGQNERRSIQTLARLSGVPYPTIRRITQKESSASLETAIALLNVVATVPETMDYFSDIECATRFFKRFAEYSSPKGEPDLQAHFMDRESFWIMMLGLTVGATPQRVRDLLGTYGLAALDQLVEKGVMYEKTPEVFMTRTETAFVQYHDKKLADRVGAFINDMPSCKEPLQRFLVVNVSAEAVDRMRGILKNAHEECLAISQSQEGEHLVAFSFVAKSIMTPD